MPPTNCDHCQCRLDIRHVLLECQKFNVARRILAVTSRNLRMPMNLETLLGNSEPALIDELFNYLRKCDIYDKL